MAAITELYMLTPPAAAGSGTQGRTHTATWHAVVDAVLPGDFVLALAQELVGTLPAGAVEVPNLGDRMLWAQGKVQEDTGQAVSVFMTTFNGADDDPYADAGAYALDFDTQPTSNKYEWNISVTWRPPQQGANELPRQVAQFVAAQDPLNPWGGGVPFTGATANAAVERWMEWRTYERTQHFGYKKIGPTVQSLKLPMLMPNQDPYPPFVAEFIHPVFVESKIVSSPEAAVDRNKLFHGTMNSDVVNFGGYSAPKYTAVFESARTGRPLVNGNTEYYRMETRVGLFFEEQVITRQAIGIRERDIATGDKWKVKDKDGIPVERLPLNSVGRIAATDADIHSDTHSPFKPVMYAPTFSYTS